MPVLTQRPIDVIRYVLLCVLSFAALAFIVMSWRWVIIGDTQVIHYVDFLIDHGLAPYRQITDINMPGTYASEHLAIHLFGAGDLGWRVYDFTLLALMTLGMVLIARPYDWLAGLFAGVLFTLIHGTESAFNAAQREEVMMVLLILAYAALFHAVRRNKPPLTGVAGLLIGLAATVKPTAVIFGPVLILMACFVLHRRGKPFLRHLLFGCIGLCIAASFVVLYLLHFHVLNEFLYIVLHVIPNYTTIRSASIGHMVKNALPLHAALLLLVAMIATLLICRISRNPRASQERSAIPAPMERWESAAIWIGIVLSLISFFLQHKGYPYQRYPTLAFVLLWAGIQIFRALRIPGLPQGLAIAALAFAVLIMVPIDLRLIHRCHARDYLTSYLRKDLRSIGDAPLQHQVQCLDMIYGCMNALYRERIVQYTGSTGDLLYFQPVDTPIVDHYRSTFLQELQSDPPGAFVLTNMRYLDTPTFNKIWVWPDFARFLEQNYVLTVQREFDNELLPPSPLGTDSTNAHSYRIYIRKDSPMLAAAQRIQ